MLTELKVSNFAIIENVHICFQEGLNILSGETGAGKSILLKSLSLLMGEKSSADSVRTGQEHAVVEGSFDLSERPDLKAAIHEQGIETPENQLVVRRIISSQGKSRIYINGSLSTLHVLQGVVSPLVEVTGQAAPLIEMTGQHDNRSLLSKTYHLDLLDLFAGLMSARRSYHQHYKRYLDIQKELAVLSNESREREQRLDFLRYQRDEIAALNLQPGEEESLESQYARARHSSKLMEFASTVESNLAGDEDSVLARLQRLSSSAVEFSKLDPTVEKKLEPLTQARAMIEDVAYSFGTYGQSLNQQDLDINAIEERMSQLRKLQKKFGTSVSEILGELTRIEGEIESLENADDRVLELQNESANVRRILEDEATKLHRVRVEQAKALSKLVNKELSELNMKGVTFIIEARATELHASGITDVEFMIQASTKDQPRPISKVASGGELSRILLALKNVVGANEQPRTYLFDEVDTGVSGTTAEKVGRKLKAIAKGQQVICVTHLPQVASFGDTHFLIQKSTSKNGVQMDVEELNTKSRVQEIARLISGEKITKTSLDHATQLLKECRA